MESTDRLLADARVEVARKSRELIHEDTAWKWAARAIVAFELHERGPSDATDWLIDAADFYHEALEHAAVADHSGDVLRRVREWIHRYVPEGAI